jgi:hypothetical protein
MAVAFAKDKKRKSKIKLERMHGNCKKKLQKVVDNNLVFKVFYFE